MHKTNQVIKARVSSEGKISLPAAWRRQAGVRPGDTVSLEIDGDALHIRSRAALVDELADFTATLFAGTGYSVDAFIAERREEAAREDRR